MPSDDPIILEPPPTNPPGGGNEQARASQYEGPPITVQPVKVSWYKKWSTHLAGINFAAVVAFYAMLPDRMLDAIPAAVHGLIGVSLLATGLIPAATSVKQVKKVE